MSVRRNVQRFYRRDFTQASDGAKTVRLEKIYGLIPEELSKQNRRFVYSSVEDGAKGRDLNDDFIWLEKSGVVIPVYNVEAPTLPLPISSNSSLMKLFYNDVGLLVTSYGKGRFFPC